MADFPEEGTYRIKSVSLGSYASVLKDENVLRGEPNEGNPWNLQYIVYDSGDERVCLLSEADVKCHCYLGVGSVANNIPIYRGKEPQLWYLRKEADGISIHQVSSGVIYAWSLNNEGEPVTLSDQVNPSRGWQSWEFVKL